MTIYEKISARQKFYENFIRDILGMRLLQDNQTWELTGINDIGYPYFSKVKNNKAQQKQFCLLGKTPDWMRAEVFKQTIKQEKEGEK